MPIMLQDANDRGTSTGLLLNLPWQSPPIIHISVKINGILPTFELCSFNSLYIFFRFSYPGFKITEGSPTTIHYDSLPLDIS